MIHIIFSPVSVVNESFDCVIQSWGAIVPMMNGTMICNNFYWGYCYNLLLLIWIMIYKYYYRQLLNGISGSSCKDVAMHFLNHSAYHRMVFIKFFLFTFLLILSRQYLCYTVSQQPDDLREWGRNLSRCNPGCSCREPMVFCAGEVPHDHCWKKTIVKTRKQYIMD